MHTPNYSMHGISQKNCKNSTKGFTGRQYWIRITSALSDIEHYQNEYENGCTRGILRNDPLANKLGMVEDGLSYSPIKVLALTLQSCIGRAYFASDLLHYFYFVTPSS